jgi:chromate transporter
MAPTDTRGRYAEVAAFFLRLGFLAFGGPAAHLAMMEHEAVVRRRWLTREEFLDLVGVTSLLPGPSSTEMAILLGLRRAGWPGLLLGGVCFILPAALLSLGLAWIYVRWGSLPQLAGLLYGVKPVIIAIVLQALVRLGRTAVKSAMLGAIAAAAIAAALFEVNPLLTIVAAGVLSIAWTRAQQRSSTDGKSLVLILTSASGIAGTTTAFGLWPLFLFFLKVGAVLFGSGYVLLAFLRSDLVEHWHWLTEAQLLDAVAVGQVTPGPVFTTATFIGYLLGGFPGAGLATLAIFLPAFVLVAASGRFVPRLRRSPSAGAFLDGVNVASLGLMAAVAWQLARTAVVDARSLALAILATALLFRFRFNSAWLILGGALAGLALQMLG